MEKILVTGANGQLGSELAIIAVKYPQHQWIFASRSQITLDDLNLLQMQLVELQPTIILNCGAYTAVDKAETEIELANVINHLAVEVIAKYSAKNKVRLIHVSTDYVFDGTSSVALDEEAPTKPINVYGDTKRLGELACLKENPDSIIIRTSWVYSKVGNNFVKTMQRLMQERESISVVNDQIGSPTYAADLAQTMIEIISSDEWTSGIYNYSNEGEISWYEFALAIKDIGGYNCKVNGIASSAYPTPAKRPSFSLLDKNKIKKVYGVDVPNYKASLKQMLAQL
ncbi:dTDP-4-dehydrorhamnose reductase [Flavobacterium sp. ALJ2]|uniref:dTDP-4-dehydrorhamnose reductase n=1 Tax=Flavobacterium sp. ALJ2 TaxID=2786960 RepID=UPI00189E2A77|nr:dTDP-4-dehydrorhamnose reductase [Flavobacterium sp. ALJ2]MBF7090632.1 dTDP-4-dehydrorhamnose reductase [Flavobacterium sp. ALJ2]